MSGAAGDLLLKDVPSACQDCARALCLRQQIINLALGNAEEMRCLFCLAKENGGEPEAVISGTKAYILSRDCFRKEWIKYVSEDFCPDRSGCFPNTCFGH